MEFYLLEDREPAFNLNANTAITLRNLGLLKKTNIERVHFCGVVVTDGKIFVVAPRNSLKSKRLTNFHNSQIAALILRMLDKYHTFSISALRGGSEPDDGEEGLSILSNILSLLNDYAANGLYTTSIKSHEVNSGKINWNRTISRETPYSGVGGAPVYMRLHSERLRFGTQSPVTLIHSEIIKALDHSFCWAVTGDASIRVAADLDVMPLSPLPHDAKISLLKKELNLVYADRDIKLLRALINYLESKNQGTDGEFLIGVRFFQNVWEEMLRCTIPSVININSYLPKPAIYLKGQKKPILAKGMITDIVSKNDDIISVIDAKYYKAETAKDSPGWADIVKQFYYAKSLEEIFPDSKITSWFAFPGDQPNISDGPVSKIAVININNDKPIVKDFPPIGCSYFCPIDVMQRYASSRKYYVNEVLAIYSQVELGEITKA